MAISAEVFDGVAIPVKAGFFQVIVDAGTGAASFNQKARGIPDHLLADTQNTSDEDYTLGPLPDCTLTANITGDAKMYLIPL